MKRIIVFGASGDIGIYLIDYLHKYFKDEYEIIAVGTRCTNYFDRFGIKYIRVDITSVDAFHSLPEDNIYAVIHLSGVMSAHMKKYNPQSYIDVNITGTLNILEYCRMNNINRILYAQSWSDLAGYVGESNLVIRPYMPRKLKLVGDHAVYSISKSAAVDLIEHYHQEYGIKSFIFRLPNIYMYHPEEYYYVDGNSTIIAYRHMIRRATEGLPIELWGNPSKSKDIIYIKDLCQLFCKAIAIKAVSSGTYNAGTGVRTTMLAQIEGIIKVFSQKNKKSVIIYCPEKPDCPDYVMDIENAKNELGYFPQYDYIAYLEDYKKEMQSDRFK